jgi:hypothetical protein
MVLKLVVMTTSNGETYWVVNQVGPEEAGQSLLRHIDNKTEILVSDTTLFPIKVSDKVPAAVAAELNKSALALSPSVGGPSGDQLQLGDDLTESRSPGRALSARWGRLTSPTSSL